MISSADLIFEGEGEGKQAQVSGISRRLRDYTNPMEIPDPMFTNYFRLNKDAFLSVLNELKYYFKPTRDCAVPLMLKLLCALRFFATGRYQKCVGNDFDFGLSQSIVSIIMSEVIEICQVKLCPTWIKSDMSEREKQDARTYFYEKARLPGIIGCVDGTHIEIITPGEWRNQFLNRKGSCSLNTMIACDHKMTIRYVDARYPGSTNDSFVWNASALNVISQSWWQSGERSIFLADSDYPLLPYLLTPYRNAFPESRESSFNKAHSETRNVVERTIAVLKSRFRCLFNERKLHYAPLKATKIVNVCCALHNVCCYFNVTNPEGVEDVYNAERSIHDSEAQFQTMEGERTRRQILDSLYNYSTEIE